MIQSIVEVVVQFVRLVLPVLMDSVFLQRLALVELNCARQLQMRLVWEVVFVQIYKPILIIVDLVQMLVNQVYAKTVIV